MTVKTPGGEPVRLRVAGVVYDPSLAPAPQQQTGNGYLSTASLAMSGGRAVLDQLKIQVAEPGRATPSRDRVAIVAVAGDVGEWLQREHGLAIREIQVPEPYAHPHQGQADALLLSLLAGGGIALLLSTILVANMLNALFSQQIPQIGIMKAIGARSGRIGRLYLAMTLVVAAAATLLCATPRHPDRPRRGLRNPRVPRHRGRQPRGSLVDLPGGRRCRPRPATVDGPDTAGQNQPHHRTGGHRPPRPWLDA